MAKQKGIHQIKGKVGDMSYYQSAGVPGGLIRRIPEGLSSRVKTADEYANTRLNNDEFKNAAAIAAFAFNAVPNRKSSMMRRFAVAEMIKEALAYIKEGSGTWGQRIPSATFDNIITDLLENHSKGGPYSEEFGVVAGEIEAGSFSVSLDYDALVASDLTAKGIEGFYAVAVVGAMAETTNTEGQIWRIFGSGGPSVHDYPIDPSGDAVTIMTGALSASAVGLLPLGYVAAQGSPNNGVFSIVTFLPYRTIGASRHVLQEFSTFVCLPLGQLPTT